MCIIRPVLRTRHHPIRKESNGFQRDRHLHDRACPRRRCCVCSGCHVANSLTPKFQLISSIPGPCESGIRDKLALSALGEHIHTCQQCLTLVYCLESRYVINTRCVAAVVNQVNMQNLSWIASLSTAYEGVQIKQFGLGLNSRSDADQQAYLV